MCNIYMCIKSRLCTVCLNKKEGFECNVKTIVPFKIVLQVQIWIE